MKIIHLDDQLSKMPNPPRDSAILTVSEYMGRFCDQVAKDMEGEPPNNDFKNLWKEKILAFQEEMIRLKPILSTSNAQSSWFATQPNSPKSTYTTPINTPRKPRPMKKDPDNADVVSLLSDGESSPTAKKRKVDATPTPTPTPSSRRKRDVRTKAPESRPYHYNEFPVDEVRRLAKAVSTCDVPGRLDPRAVDHIITKAVLVWNRPVSNFVGDFKSLLGSHLKSTLQDKLSVWISTDFYRQSAQIVDVFVKKLADDLNCFAEYVLRVEQFKPITCDVSLASKNVDELHRLETERFKSRAHAYFDEQDELAGNTTNPAERKRQIERENGKALRSILGPDPYANEVRMLAETRAYYDIASVRLVDSIWMNIRADVLEKCRTGLLEELKAGLNLYADNGTLIIFLKKIFFFASLLLNFQKFFLVFFCVAVNVICTT